MYYSQLSSLFVLSSLPSTRMIVLTSLLDTIETTSEVTIPTDPFERIVGQEHAVRLVRAAVQQRRHVLLCGVPGVGKSLLAKAASTLLPPPKQEIRIRHNPAQPDRPTVRIVCMSSSSPSTQSRSEVRYTRPEFLPFEVAVKMGFRCPLCGALSHPDQPVCIECGSRKRSEWAAGADSYLGLFRTLDLVGERAVKEVFCEQSAWGVPVIYQRENNMIKLVFCESPASVQSEGQSGTEDERVLVGINSSRFIHVSGSNPVELLGDVKHDPYGSAEHLGTPSYLRIVPGAIHEAHEGILFIDEIATLGPYQKHLLTAMQDKQFPITAHNPQSSGASVRVDNVPCDFILFASCNLEDLPLLLPPLRSRIRGYGYEIMLSSWIENTPSNVDALVRFIAQTVHEDGRIPHLTAEAVRSVLEFAEEMAFRSDGKRNALSLRLRELGGLVRIAGDHAVQDGSKYVQPEHIQQARETLSGLVDYYASFDTTKNSREQGVVKVHDGYGSYFF